MKTASAVHAFCRIRIGLQDNKCTVTEKLASIIKQLGIQIHHKAGDASVHLSKQGNPMMYTQNYLQARAALRTDPRVQKAIRQMWNTEVILSIQKTIFMVIQCGTSKSFYSSRNRETTDFEMTEIRHNGF